MDILGDRRFVEIPGSEKHVLPPLLVRTAAGIRRLDRVMDMAEQVVEREEMIPARPVEDELDLQRRRMDLAINLVEQYLGFIQQWQWGEGIVEWIRQCETTFESRPGLRSLLRPDVWPHAARSSFVTLIGDKAVPTGGVEVEKAVGLRLTFRQPPPLKCFSDQFLLYLNSPVAASAYRTWACMSPSPVSSLPPERFEFQVLSTSLE
ncbi:MAG TPA: hypothetical protein VGR73_13615 [Bryobacteraceae bacterium]|nr:hypothetical protein [Bryobacteraceae bacterium]